MPSAVEHILVWRARRIKDPVERLRFLRRRSAMPPPRRKGRFIALAAVAAMLCWLPASAPRTPESPAPPAGVTEMVKPEAPGRIWLVERTDAHELYSNGLRIETRYETANKPRSYVVFNDGKPAPATAPAGIIFHSTESHLLPFDPQQNRSLQATTAEVLNYVRRRHSYHYLIDRFGRVYRVTPENHSADHAGNSAWAWAEGVCLNLNHAFFGVAFEARTGEELTAAQTASGRTLTDALRVRFAIRAENCVTHAQVSVNPANMRVGWHTDWARGFPFAALGLPDNYELPLASVTELGFSFDSAYLDTAGEGLWIGVHRSETRLKELAAQRGIGVAQWRRALASRYRELAKRG